MTPHIFTSSLFQRFRSLSSFLPAASLPAMLFFAGLLFLSASRDAYCQNLLPNGDFENDKHGWNLFVPEESQESECTFEVIGDNPHEGAFAAQLDSVSEARYAIVTRPKGADLVAGAKFRISVWVRAGANFVPKPGTPGFMVRITLFSDAGTVDAPGGHYYLGLGNHLIHGLDIDSMPQDAIPKTWTKVEAVIEIPPEVESLNVSAFVWQGVGTLWVDDMVFEPVDADTSLTEVRP